FSFFFSSRRRHTRSKRDWSSDVCSSDLLTTARTAFFILKARFKRLSNNIRAFFAFGIFLGLLLFFFFLTLLKLFGQTASFFSSRSEERRVGKESRSRGGQYV